MAKQSGLGDRLLVHGYDLSGDIGSIQRVAGPNTPLDVTDITQSAYERRGGIRDGGIDFTAYFNPSPGRAHLRLSTLPYSDVVVTYCRGYTLGAATASGVMKQLNYDGTRGQDGSYTLVTQTVSNGFGVDWGNLMTNGLRTDTTATNGTGIDGGAASAFGAQFFLQLQAFTGTSVVVKIQDSADNATFADLAGAAFTSAVGPTSERIAVTGTVRRYLRVVTTGTFTVANFAVAGTRNLSAVVF